MRKFLAAMFSIALLAFTLVVVASYVAALGFSIALLFTPLTGAALTLARISLVLVLLHLGYRFSLWLHQAITNGTVWSLRVLHPSLD